MVIATGSTMSAALAAQAATRTIPIVFLNGLDPVKYGLVASLARPGGNMTGFTALTAEVNGKRVALLRELVPMATTVAFLFDPMSPSDQTMEVQNAARTLGLRLLMIGASRQSDIEPAFTRMAQQHVSALLVSSDTLFYAHNDHIVALAAHHAIPAVFVTREAVRAGGLMNYGSNIPDQYHQVGVYVGRILKGEKPASLPVQQPTKFELTINLKTAKALDLTIPETLLATADEVIQ
jgi:putative tryptophan/tyrosine transport system substrate-binding protein